MNETMWEGSTTANQDSTSSARGLGENTIQLSPTKSEQHTPGLLAVEEGGTPGRLSLLPAGPRSFRHLSLHLVPLVLVPFPS